MAFLSRQLREFIRQRAQARCEYCRLPELYTIEPFWIDHIIAEQHGGMTEAENLAFSCMRCNRHKGPNLAGRDPVTGSIVTLFNPWADRWDDHFRWEGPIASGITPLGRATLVALAMNGPSRVAARESLLALGVFPAT